MEFEDILGQVGGCGKYQKQLLVFFYFPMLNALAWSTLNGMFMVSVPEHWCRVESVAASNLSISNQRTLISPLRDPSCSMYDVNYTEYLYAYNLTAINDTNVVQCTSGWQYDKRDYDETASSKWNLVCDRSYFRSLILTLEGVGSIILTPIYGFLADRYGRKTVYLLLAAFTSVLGISSVLVDDFIAFVVLRTIYGGLMPTVFTLPLILLLEIVEPEMRAHMNGIFNIFWSIGLSTLPLVAYLTRNWVYLGLVCSIGCASNLLYFKYIPESPSWLISRGRYEEATTLMECIGKKNGKPQDPACLLKQLQTLGHSMQERKKTKESHLYLLKSPRIRKYFLILCFTWIAFYSTYYGFMYNLSNLAGNEFLNFFLLCIAEIPGSIMFWILMDRFGRRWTASMGFSVLAFVCLLPLTGFQYSDTISSMLGKLISSGTFVVTIQQGTEVFPTVARSFALNLGKTIARGITILIPFYADLGAHGKELPFIIMACISLVTSILASFLPETLNQNLPQTISDAEEIGRDDKFFSCIRRKCPVSSDETLEQQTGDENGSNVSEYKSYL